MYGITLPLKIHAFSGTAAKGDGLGQIERNLIVNLGFMRLPTISDFSCGFDISLYRVPFFAMHSMSDFMQIQ